MRSFVQLKPGFDIAPGQRILKAEDYSNYLEGQDLIQAARDEAARIVAEAQDAYEAERQRGYVDGLMEGKMEAAEQMMETVAKTVNYFETVEHRIADVVQSALRKILGSFDERDLVVRMVRGTLAVARNQRQVTLRVAPHLVETVRDRVDEIMADYPVIQFIDVAPDPRAKDGGCILESEIGVVDASLEVQLKAIKNALLRGFEQRKE